MNYIDMIEPANPMSVLVAADWLEESGHTTEADALRILTPPITDNNYGYFDGLGDGSICNRGYGYKYGHGDGFISNSDNGYGDGDYYGNGYDRGLGHGRGYGYDYNDNYAEFLDYVLQMRIFLKGELAEPVWR